MNPCNVCGSGTINKCSNCNQIFYCSVEHQKSDWKSHKSNCFPFKIEHNEQLGRHLVATRTIKPFEIILKESPLVRGPSQITPPVCLGCLNAIETANYINCEKCGFPLCSAACKESKEHAAECELTAQRGQKVNVTNFTDVHPLYQCISTVRSLLLVNSNTPHWEKLQKLESLENERKGSLQWKTDLENIGKFIPKFFKTSNFKEDDIMRMIGVLQINGHEVPTTDPPHVAVYYTASFLEHSCIPNLAKSFTATGQIVFWAPKAITKGSHLSICYSDAVWGTADRQKHLMHTKWFRCNCPRCLDVTEFNTYYDALKCDNKMCKGLLMPENLKNWNATWSCNTCTHKASNSVIMSALATAGKEMSSMEKTTENLIKFISNFEKSLSDNHFFLCEVKIKLIQEIGNDPKELMIVSTDLLDLKIQYARQLIDLYEKIAPCEIRLLGTICFELHSGLAEKARRVSLKTSLSPLNFLEESLFYVEKTIQYLQHESNLFIEGHILKQAKINRGALRMVITT